MKETNVNDQEPIKWGGLLNEFLWICAGVNRKLVRQCPTDYAKYAGQGGLILFTGLMAMLSGGYAFSTIFDNTALAVAFGVFWGLLIFNLDRFIVNTMYSDGKHTISWFELMAGLPRIVIAIFLGIVISTPLEMKIFGDQIESQLLQDNAKRIEDAKKAHHSLYDERIGYETKKNDIETEGNQLQRRLLNAQEDLRREAEGSGPSGKIGHGPIYIDKERFVNECQIAYDRWESSTRAELERLNSEIDRITGDIRKQESQINKDANQKGFAVKYEAFANIKKENEAVRLVSIFIMLMFVIIEIAPTFFKMMVAYGPYDDLLRAEVIKKKAYADKVVAETTNELKTAISISTKTNEEKEIIELKNNKELLTKIANIQSEVLEVAIQKWREEELEKAKNNPSTFIKNS